MSFSLRIFLFTVALAACAIPGIPQNPLTAYPNNYKLVLDNTDVTVIRVHYGAHEKLAVHDHSKFPTVYIYLSDAGPVRFSHDEIPPFVITRPPVKAGSFRVSPGRIERHTVENLGSQSSDYLRIEFKKLPVRNALHPVRGVAPATLHAGTKEEFSSPELSIERMICNPGPACSAKASKYPTLLVAFSPLDVITSGSTHTEMRNGDVVWLDKQEARAVAATTRAPAHLLLLEFHPPPH